MKRTNDQCPSDLDLRQFSVGKHMDKETRQEIEEHVHRCPRCAAICTELDEVQVTRLLLEYPPEGYEDQVEAHARLLGSNPGPESGATGRGES